MFSRIPELRHIDLCKNPEGICQNDEAKWLGAIFYWAENVQGYSVAKYRENWLTSLNKFVDSRFNRASSFHNGADFVSGTGGVVNNGFWAATPHENSKRLANFDRIMGYLKTGGMETCN